MSLGSASHESLMASNTSSRKVSRTIDISRAANGILQLINRTNHKQIKAIL